jgi:hypothetical protein
MSFSKPKLTNPANAFIKYKAEDGTFEFFDKSLGEKGENVKIKLPCRFIVLDQLSTIKGWNDSTKSMIYSNEIHYLKDELLKVKSFKGDLSIIGKYDDIKDEIALKGGKFCSSVYVAMKTKDGYELNNFQFTGAALGAWFEFQKKNNLETCCVEIKSEHSSGKKGKVEYCIPIFYKLELTTDQVALASKMDEELQKYFVAYKNQNHHDVIIKSEISKTGDDFISKNYKEEILERSNDEEMRAEIDDLPF